MRSKTFDVIELFRSKTLEVKKIVKKMILKILSNIFETKNILDQKLFKLSRHFQLFKLFKVFNVISDQSDENV